MAKDLIKQVIWQTLNRHCSGPRPDIALIGSRRSGSTLLMQMVAVEPGMKFVNQPFSRYTATSFQARYLPAVDGEVYLDLIEQERDLLRDYVKALQAGSLHVAEPARFWQRDFAFRSNRLVLKTTSAHFLEDMLEQMGLTIVRYMRHPVPQAQSCLRNGWGDKLASFRRSRLFWDEWLNPVQRDLFDVAAGQGSGLGRYVLGWCCENMPLFHPKQGVETIFYEDIVLQPADVVRRLGAACDLRNLDAMAQRSRKASQSVRNLSEAQTARAIAKGGLDRQDLARWMDRIEDADRELVARILDAFPGCPYRADDPLPCTGLTA